MFSLDDYFTFPLSKNVYYSYLATKENYFCQLVNGNAPKMLKFVQLIKTEIKSILKNLSGFCIKKSIIVSLLMLCLTIS